MRRRSRGRFRSRCRLRGRGSGRFGAFDRFTAFIRAARKIDRPRHALARDGPVKLIPSPDASTLLPRFLASFSLRNSSRHSFSLSLASADHFIEGLQGCIGIRAGVLGVCPPLPAWPLPRPRLGGRCFQRGCCPLRWLFQNRVARFCGNLFCTFRSLALDVCKSPQPAGIGDFFQRAPFPRSASVVAAFLDGAQDVLGHAERTVAYRAVDFALDGAAFLGGGNCSDGRKNAWGSTPPTSRMSTEMPRRIIAHQGVL